MARTRAITLLTAAGLLLTGCGSSHPSSPDPTSPSPAFAAAADAVCSRQLAQLNTLTRPTTAEAAVSYLPHALSVMRAELRQLSALHPPASERVAFAGALAGEQRLTALLGRFLHELRSAIVELGSFARAQAQSDALRADIDAHFRQAGLAHCVQ